MDMPKDFKVPKSILGKLPESERAGAAEYLWQKSSDGGKCALCDRPLPADGKKIDIDHRLAEKEGMGGETKLSNLYLSHAQCNRMRGNKQFGLAKRIIKFKLWTQEQTDEVTFDEVSKQYVQNGNQHASFSVENDTAVLTCGGYVAHSSISVDPATGVKYFFAEVPVTHVMNDSKTQPRSIMPDHVARLAEDFSLHPVHEPSNCRLVQTTGNFAELLQFDGQHKTTAQIILGRKTVPMKIYVEPPIEMIQELVVQIQQGIKKVPLSTADTLRKLGDVITHKLDEYKPSGTRSEKGFIASQPLDQQTNVKKQFLSDLQNAIFDDDGNKLAAFAYSGPLKSDLKPLPDTVVVNKIIKPLMYQQLLEDDMDAPGYGRNHEQANVLFILNEIADQMLVDKWTEDSQTLDRTRATNFFYQASIGWWLNEILVPATRHILNAASRPKGSFSSETEQERKGQDQEVDRKYVLMANVVNGRAEYTCGDAEQHSRECEREAAEFRRKNL